MTGGQEDQADQADHGGRGETARARTPFRAWLARAVYALLGVALIGLGAAILQVGDVGVDPYTALNIGISEHLGWSLGEYQLLSNAVLFIPVLLFGRKYIGVGTIINMVLTGFFIDIFSPLLEPLQPAQPTLLTSAVFFVVGIICFGFGASAYMSAGVGTAPYDALAPIIVDRTGWQYQRVRVPQDLAFLVGAVVAQGPVGVGTIMTAFFCGPLIAVFTDKVNRPAVRKITADLGERPSGQHAGDPTKL